MNTYMLYGTKMIEKDATLKDFASCIYNNIPRQYRILFFAIGKFI